MTSNDINKLIGMIFTASYELLESGVMSKMGDGFRMRMLLVDSLTGEALLLFTLKDYGLELKHFLPKLRKIYEQE